MLASRQYGGPTTTADVVEIAPHSSEAEQAVLGSLLADATQFDAVSELLSASDFFRPEHRHLFEAIARLHGAGHMIDPVTLANQLTIAGVLDQCGGMGQLVRLQNDHASGGVLEHAAIVRERSMIRRLRQLGQAVLRASTGPQMPESADLIEQLEAGLTELQTDHDLGQRGFSRIADLVPRFMDELDRRSETGSAITGVASGFVDLDRMLAGLQPSDLIIIAGRPSMGKTALAMNIAEHAALREGVAVGVFSMEMSKEQLFGRMVSSVGGVNAGRLRTGALEDAEWPKVAAATTELSTAKILIDDTAGLSPRELRTRARRMKREANIGLIVVDYLQLMEGDGKAENRTNEISQISRKLKALAKELGIPVIALSQLNRLLEQRFDKRPVMADLRDSGGIEQDADVILFVYRDVVYNPESDARDLAEIIIGKQRNGPIGQVLLQFQGEYTRFSNQGGVRHPFV